jgi:hypothetical protein
VAHDGDFLRTSCGSPNYAAPEVIRCLLNACSSDDDICCRLSQATSTLVQRWMYGVAGSFFMLFCVARCLLMTKAYRIYLKKSNPVSVGIIFLVKDFHPNILLARHVQLTESFISIFARSDLANARRRSYETYYNSGDTSTPMVSS